jgi:hypothetical protein
MYEVECPNRSTDAISWNTGNLYAQMDKKGNICQNLKETVGHKKYNCAISKDNGWTMFGYGQRKPTTKWRFQVD